MPTDPNCDFSGWKITDIEICFPCKETISWRAGWDWFSIKGDNYIHISDRKVVIGPISTTATRICSLDLGDAVPLGTFVRGWLLGGYFIISPEPKDDCATFIARYPIPSLTRYGYNGSSCYNECLLGVRPMSVCVEPDGQYFALVEYGGKTSVYDSGLNCLVSLNHDVIKPLKLRSDNGAGMIVLTYINAGDPEEIKHTLKVRIFRY
jgi:hypothetical protein